MLRMTYGEDGRFARAMQHKMNGDYDAAEALLESLISDQPDNAKAYHELGLVYRYRVKETESITALEKAVELDPESARYLEDLGRTFLLFGDDKRAEPIFEKLIEFLNFDGGW